MNRMLVVLSLALLSLASAANDGTVVRLSEPVLVTSDAEVFGAELDPTASSVDLNTLLGAPESFLERALRVETRVSQICQKKGCFYIASDGERTVRVSFKDYGFFLPTDIGGRTVTMTGILVRRELSESEAQHFREDANSDTIQAGVVYELVADAVSVPLS